MSAQKFPVSLDQVLEWAVDQGALLQEPLPCSREIAIDVVKNFYPAFRALIEGADNLGVLQEGLSTPISDWILLWEICDDNGIELPDELRQDTP